MTTSARLCPRTLRAQYVREMRDMAALVLDLRALRQDVRADEMTLRMTARTMHQQKQARGQARENTSAPEATKKGRSHNSERRRNGGVES